VGPHKLENSIHLYNASPAPSLDCMIAPSISSEDTPLEFKRNIAPLHNYSCGCSTLQPQFLRSSAPTTPFSQPENSPQIIFFASNNGSATTSGGGKTWWGNGATPWGVKEKIDRASTPTRTSPSYPQTLHIQFNSRNKVFADSTSIFLIKYKVSMVFHFLSTFRFQRISTVARHIINWVNAIKHSTL